MPAAPVKTCPLCGLRFSNPPSSSCIDRQTEPGLAVHVICDNLRSKALAITRRDPRPSPNSRRVGAAPIGGGAGQRARRMTGDPEGGPPGVRLADPCPAPDRRVR